MPVTRRKQAKMSETTPLLLDPSTARDSTPIAPTVEIDPQSPVQTSAKASSMMESLRTSWIGLAAASGACAAFNGVFAKLTTTELTTRFAASISHALGLAESKVIEYIIRAAFFGLNLLFNGVMWGLFTAALAKGSSSTKVSILNTSSNFMLTALLGFMIFSESLPPLWWLGAAFLVAGNVIIGRREEAAEGAVALSTDSTDTDNPEAQVLLDDQETTN